MSSPENYFKMTGMKSGGSGLFENLANKTLEQYLANNIHNGSPSMVRERASFDLYRAAK